MPNQRMIVEISAGKLGNSRTNPVSERLSIQGVDRSPARIQS